MRGYTQHIFSPVSLKFGSELSAAISEDLGIAALLREGALEIIWLLGLLFLLQMRKPRGGGAEGHVRVLVCQDQPLETQKSPGPS